MIQIKRQNSKKTAIKAGVAGAMLGAAGAAIGMTLKDKKNRDTVKKSLSEAKKWTQDKVESMQKDTQKTTKPVKEEVKKAQKKVESQMEEV